MSLPIAGVLSILTSLVSTFFLIPFFINYFKSIGLVDTDENKKNKPLVPTSVGIPVLFGIIFGLLVYAGVKTFVTKDLTGQIELFAVCVSIFLITFIGFMDDLNTRQVLQDGFSVKKGIRQWQKPLLTLPAALPLMVIKAGNSLISLPVIGVVDLGLFYPLLLVPLGVVGAANMINLLGGFNGSEMGMGLLYTSYFGFMSYFYLNNVIASLIFFSTSAALLAGLYYNFVPAKIMSGDSIQYLLGGVVASGVILANMEKIAIVALMPFIIEFGLKLRKRLNASCMGVLQADGTLKSRYKKIYSWTHIIMKSGRYTEKQVVFRLYALQLVFILLSFVVFSI